ncbi:MAG: hypothetical protein CMO01_00560 [Thalassobius sp.]|nr:hypothetical protein [Thalassovita sp.]
MKVINNNVSIQKKILIFFILMLCIILVGALVFWYNNKKSDQQFAMAMLLKECYLVVDKVNLYSNELMEQEKSISFTSLRGELDKLDDYFFLLKDGGHFALNDKFLHIESVSGSHREELHKLLNRWDTYKSLLLTLTDNNSYSVSKKLLIDEKQKLIIEELDIFSNLLLTDVEQEENISSYILLIVVFSAFTGLFLGYHFILNTAIKPLKRITKTTRTLAFGQNVEVFPEDKKDEIGQLYKSVNLLNINLTKVSNFANDIGNGNFEATFEARSKNDLLGHALLDMRNNLKKVVHEDQKRNWANKNLADFAELLRIHSENLEELSYKIVARLVYCLKANQGGFFLLSEDGDKLELKGSYAYNKRKYIEKVIDSTHGLTGQCLQEGKPIYLKEIPQDYMEITSGLGGARPSSLLLLPLIENDNGYGVIEISSIEEMDDYKIKFAEMVAEDIASSLSVLKANEKTKELLTESQLKNEKRKSNELQMSQKLAELEVSAEQWKNKETELVKRESKLANIIEAAPYCLLIITPSKKVEYFNSYLADFFKQKGIFVAKDISVLQLLPTNEIKLWDKYFEQSRKGEVITDILNWRHIQGFDIYLQIMINKIEAEEGNFEGWVIRINEISYLHPVRW